jgi:hypothetical protein
VRSRPSGTSDPRLVNQVKVTITRAAPMDEDVRVALEAAADRQDAVAEGAGEATAAGKKPKKPKTKCVEGYILTKEMGSPALPKAQQSINWCYNGKKVSEWSGFRQASVQPERLASVPSQR